MKMSFTANFSVFTQFFCTAEKKLLRGEKNEPFKIQSTRNCISIELPDETFKPLLIPKNVYKKKKCDKKK